jgi:choline dehydrogenase
LACPNTADIVLLREGLKLARTLGSTQPLNSSIASEIFPGDKIVTDADWDNWIPGVIGTEYHPSSTCAMLPLELGGVVDPNLKVYGTANVRVVDASVFPIEFAAHVRISTRCALFAWCLHLTSYADAITLR